MAAVASVQGLSLARAAPVARRAARPAKTVRSVTVAAAPKLEAKEVAPLALATAAVAAPAQASELVAEVANNPALPLLANVFGIFIPCTFLIILYIKSKGQGEVE